MTTNAWKEVGEKLKAEKPFVDYIKGLPDDVFNRFAAALMNGRSPYFSYVFLTKTAKLTGEHKLPMDAFRKWHSVNPDMMDRHVNADHGHKRLQLRDFEQRQRFVWKLREIHYGKGHPRAHPKAGSPVRASADANHPNAGNYAHTD